MANVNRPNAPQDYRTPRALLDAVEARFGKIDFDAACDDANCVADTGLGFWQPDYDALAEDWRMLENLVVWCNPRFRDSRLYAAKAAASQKTPEPPTVLLLVPAAVDSNWFRTHVHGQALVLPLSPRVAFVGQPAAINRPLMLCAYGPNITPGFEPWPWAEKQPRKKK